MLIYIYIKTLYCGLTVLLGGFLVGLVGSGCHKLSENIWLVWSRTPYSGEKVGCDVCGRTYGRTDDGNVKIGLEFWILNSQLPEFEQMTPAPSWEPQSSSVT